MQVVDDMELVAESQLWAWNGLAVSLVGMLATIQSHTQILPKQKQAHLLREQQASPTSDLKSEYNAPQCRWPNTLLRWGILVHIL